MVFLGVPRVAYACVAQPIDLVSATLKAVHAVEHALEVATAG
ncbi:hypothetical protein MSP7336_03408 [Mycobacterium shimoidei]|uniref:Uncharacterized protein n=1 Tax=Mycobacterium shimoidei TaxID=29313 RepID=A0A375Z1T9_MYCSH|nr:hypothetical protein MSP7336_03408 [Mycobacterium shimoidei]